MTAAISVEGLSKHYRGPRAYTSLRDEVERAARRFVGKGDQRPVVKALDGIDFEVAEGSAVALIGSNGAGKSTALKVLSRITYPTDGVARVRGRVGALVEVGSGLHGELTGRENIKLYGRILGHSAAQITRRFDRIVEFAGIGAALDQPVKHYSSGMQLRLGFSVAAHLEPDVLLVDEALAVGDVGFQHRCTEHMRQLVSEGRTLLFVSHQMPVVEALCDRAIWLSAGRIQKEGPAAEVIGSYLRAAEKLLQADEAATPESASGIVIRGATLLDPSGEEVDSVMPDEPLRVRIHYFAPNAVERPLFTVGLGDGRRGCFAHASMLLDGHGPFRISGEGWIDCVFESLPLHPRVYELMVAVHGPSGGKLLRMTPVRRFLVSGEVADHGPAAVSSAHLRAPVKIPHHWRYSAD